MNKTEERLEKLEIQGALMNTNMDFIKEKLLTIEKLVSNHLAHWTFPQVMMFIAQLLTISGVVLSLTEVLLRK